MGVGGRCGWECGDTRSLLLLIMWVTMWVIMWRESSLVVSRSSLQLPLASGKMRVLDGVVAVFDGVAGVEPQSETVWRQADKYKVPGMCFLNKMDRTGVNCYFCVDTIIELLGVTPAVLQLPIGTEGDFLGVIDLVTMEAILWRGEDPGASYDVIPLAECNDVPLVDDALKEKAVEWREKNKEPFSALAFKGKSERAGRMLEMHANDRTEIKTAVAGDIIALVGLKDTTTGETLCDKKNCDSGEDGIP